MLEVGPRREDFQKIATTFESIKSLISSKHPKAEKPLAEYFQKFITQVVTDWNSLQSFNLQSSSLKLEGIKTKYKLWQMCAEKGTAYLKMFDESLSQVFTDILTQQALCLVESFNLLKDLILNNEGYEKIIKEVKDQLEEKKKEIEQILSAAESLEGSVEKLKKEKDALQFKVDNIKGDLEDQMNLLQDENKQYLEQIIKLSKTKAESSIVYSSYSPTKEQSSRSTPRPSSRSSSTPRGSGNAQIIQGSARELSLRQLKDIINEIYTSKHKYDIKCKECKQPKETMEQHLQNFLVKKYGLKSLIQEWSSAIISGIHRFEFEDSEVSLFAKILRHQIDEDFINVIKELKKVVYKLMKNNIKTKFPYIREENILEMIRDKQSGDLEDEEWQRIISYMYNEKDAQILTSKLQETIHKKQFKYAQNKISSKANISFKELMQILMDFQITNHEEYLKPLKNKFRIVDSDENGIIDDKELNELLVSMGIWEEGHRLAPLIDPDNLGVITFSDCVQLFSTESCDSESIKVGMSILEKLYHDNLSS